jgi:aminobenzoyl-glutamate transport protein
VSQASQALPAPAVATTELYPEPKTILAKFIDGIEAVGNKVPHPAVMFLLLSGVVILLSHLLYLFGASVTYEALNPATHQLEYQTVAVRSLLTADGIRFLLTSPIQNFLNFNAIGIILVVMVGVGLAEEAGLIAALIRQIVAVAPRWAITYILVFLGILSSIASDAGYLVLIPLGAAAYLSLGRHPLAGLAAAFAAVAAAFGVNILITPLDGVLTELTNDAIHLLNPGHRTDER